MDALDVVLVGQPDHRALLDAGVLLDDGLDFPRAHVLPARDDDVLEPVGDEDVSRAVTVPDVAGVQPAVLQDLGRRDGIVPVAVRHSGAADHYLARLAVRARLAAGADDVDLDPRPVTARAW